MSYLRRHRHSLRFESLESRHMLAGNVAVSLSGGNLLIKGDAAYNSLAVSSGVMPNSIVVAGFPDAQGVGTKINGKVNAVEFKNVTGNITIDLGGGSDALSLTNLKAARDVKITDLIGESTIKIGRDPGFMPPNALQHGPVTINGNLTVTTGPGADQVDVGEFGDDLSYQPLGGQSVTVKGSAVISLGAGGTSGLGSRSDALRVGRDGVASHFAVKVGKNFSADLGGGSGSASVTSLTIGGSLDIRAQNTGSYSLASVNVGNYALQEGPTSLRVDGDATITLGNGADAHVSMYTFSIGGALSVTMPVSPNFIGASGASIDMNNGTVGGKLKVSFGALDYVLIAGITADNLTIIGSAVSDFVEVGLSDTGRRSKFETVDVYVGDGDDTITFWDTTITGLATVHGGAGHDHVAFSNCRIGKLKTIAIEEVYA